MPIGSEGLPYRRFRVPREDRRVLVEPPLADVGRTVQKNVQQRLQANYDVQGRPLRQLITLARAELLAEARRWTVAYRPESAAAHCEGLIFLAGHQPELFHPGVWLKHFVLDALARRHGATAINLVIDSDDIKHAAVRTPGGSASEPSVEMIPFDRSEPRVPYEERRVEDRTLFAAFGRRVAERMAPLLGDPLVKSFWPLVLERLRETDRVGACLAQARHVLEGRWGLQTLEVPQSCLCGTESFEWFAAHLLAHLPRFSEIHNAALREYRRVHKLRSPAQPVPDLAADLPWLEAPFWVWTDDRPQRRRLFAQQAGRELRLSDRAGFDARLALFPDTDAARAVEQLGDLRRRGIKIRSRALVTTLWARLVLGDLFLHGIGGAKYDQVTDLLIERFFGLPAPGILVLSATLHLPVAQPRVPADQAAAIARQLRDLSYNPERFLREEDGEAGEPVGRPEMAAEACGAACRTAMASATPAAPLVAPPLVVPPVGVERSLRMLLDAKARWIETPQTPENARARWHAFRQINEALQPWVADCRRRLLEDQAETARVLHAKRILSWREYAFCLYPERALREFYEGATSQTTRNML